MLTDMFDAVSAPFSRTPNERRPSKFLLGLESRAVMEWAAIPWALPWLSRHTQRGDGHPVLVLPGLMATDKSTLPLREFLHRLGYNTHGWRLGRNLGPRVGVRAKMDQALADLHRHTGRKVSLIGWSLGGIYARELARSAPGIVRQVITLGSPLYGEPTSTNAWDIYRVVCDNEGDDRRGDEPPPVPTTSIYSRADGVVAWGCSVERQSPLTDNVEVNSTSHMGLGVNPLVWHVISDRLAQPEGDWRHFEPRGVNRLLFPRSKAQRT